MNLLSVRSLRTWFDTDDGIVKAVDSEKRTIAIEVHVKGEKKGKEESFVVAKDVSLADVKVGHRVELKGTSGNSAKKLGIAGKAMEANGNDDYAAL